MKTITTLATAAVVLALGLALAAPSETLAQQKGKSTRYAANRGAKLTSVLTGWPGADAGLEVGDVITRIDGTQISSTTHLTNALAGKSSVSMSVVNSRNGETISVTAYPKNGKLGIYFDIVDLDEQPQGYGAKRTQQKQSMQKKR